jgi:hypothetical protein
VHALHMHTFWLPVRGSTHAAIIKTIHTNVVTMVTSTKMTVVAKTFQSG